VHPDVDEEAPEHGLIINYGHDILVVDDSDTNLVAVEAALNPLGRTLVMARSGIEALSHLLERDFALIVLDVAMPGMDGFEVAKLVRSRARNRTTPILFVTGLAWQDEKILRGYELGACDFLMKPIRAEVLRAKATVFMQLQERTIELHEKAEELRSAQARAHERELEVQRERFETDLLEHQMKQMAESDKRKDEFLAILAHELRNPLQPLQTAVELIEADVAKPVPARVRNIIQRQVHYISRLVDDLLDVARFQSGRLELRKELVHFDKLVEEAVSAAMPAAETRGHTLTVSGTDAPIVHGDPVRLVQILSNLLSNAIKYTPPNGRIDVEYGTRDGQAFASVADTGRGLAATLLPKIFDMFVQERVAASGAGGLGLGLGLARRLAELHGGALSASSAGPEKGSTFEMRIPLADADIVAKPLPVPFTDPESRRLRAVVVDDAADLRELVADLLRMKGHEVMAVEDGRSAVALIRAERPDVALIDIGLPEMDGYEVARELRRDLPSPMLRLIAMTGYGQAADRATALQAGFDAHIVKPASADKIMRAIYGKPDP
jgi:signal transduction histidine kinase